MGDDDTARKNIEAEIKKPEEEINRIAEHTSFNGLKPLSSTLGGAYEEVAIGAKTLKPPGLLSADP